MPTGPLRLLVRGVDDQTERELASFPIPFPTSAPEKLPTTASDGSDVEAWFMPPLDLDESRQYPVLLNIHGGPYTQYGYSFFDEFQVQAGAGYGVVYCNPRGSSGYGTPWGRAILGPKFEREPGTGWGGIDTTDVLSALDAALARYPYLDPDRVGVLGGSYGGYLTSWLVTQTDRFAAACSERAVNNVATMTHTSDIGWWFNVQYAGVTAMEDTEELLRMSPVTYADRITTPLLIVHSENDWRCPIEQAEDLYTRTPPARTRRRVRALPRRGPRAVAVRRAEAPIAATRDHPGVLRPPLAAKRRSRRTPSRQLTLKHQLNVRASSGPSIVRKKWAVTQWRPGVNSSTSLPGPGWKNTWLSASLSVS